MNPLLIYITTAAIFIGIITYQYYNNQSLKEENTILKEANKFYEKQINILDERAKRNNQITEDSRKVRDLNEEATPVSPRIGEYADRIRLLQNNRTSSE